jgi:hypothetical protein
MLCTPRRSKLVNDCVYGVLDNLICGRPIIVLQNDYHSPKNLTNYGTFTAVPEDIHCPDQSLSMKRRRLRLKEDRLGSILARSGYAVA